MKKFTYYLKVWWMMSKNAFLAMLNHRVGVVVFTTGKVLRFAFFGAFLYFLLSKTNTLAGYTLHQTLFFFLTFNLIDVIAQFLFREAYRFRPLIVSGSFDLILVKPINALFRSLMGGADILDLFLIPPLVFAVYYVGSLLDPSASQVFLYIVLVANGLVIATAFHIAVLSLGIITLEIDHTIMIYRDLTNLGRLPIDIYGQPLKGILTYLVPVGVMITLPAKAMMGLVTPVGVTVSFALGFLMIILTLRFWKLALRQYTSASS
ncbi:ABC-2 family transporter protein [Patescibacteria group bacterium]|nr:ABC-2 family transporter protein [Patescibacteria group bacterium]MBU0776829.1 ABC-2 family transporter protein [Patescibacteria group bacterium]MBU0845596.1 ABC-2 family transporter protein [Patescibacteria group bacterium]MBU0922638.1 ABC-2 family transporter protein [Patescibacteria group bacterium]MBU1066689.1 ABC-2 family transporter protein [Patescibacteria group bacterium]